MNQNLFAYTETPYLTYPAYISLNKRNGKYYLSVRSSDTSETSVVEIPFLELLKLGTACRRISFESDEE
jgi:hypothetical protein